MNSQTFHLSTHAITAVKNELTSTIPHVKSSHRCEAIARGLGCRTNAALLTAIRSGQPLATVNGERFSAYLAEHGFNVPPHPFYLAVARQFIREVSEKEPLLTAWGIGVGQPRWNAKGKIQDPFELHQKFEAEREELFANKSVEQFLLSLALLQEVWPTKTIRPGTSSYWIKHIAEKFSYTYPGGYLLRPHYVSNGMLIAAALHAGFKLKTFRDELGYISHHVRFNMARKPLEELNCMLNPTSGRAQKWLGRFGNSHSF